MMMHMIREGLLNYITRNETSCLSGTWCIKAHFSNAENLYIVTLSFFIPILFLIYSTVNVSSEF